MNQRTWQVSKAIVDAVPGVDDENRVTAAHLAAITSLSPGSTWRPIASLKAGDFDGLTALSRLNLADNDLTSLPAGIFDDLTELSSLSLNDNDLTALPAGIFDNNTALSHLSLRENALTSLPAGIFDNTVLVVIFLSGNNLSALPAGIFDELTRLNWLHLDGNNLTSLPVGIFDELTHLSWLHLYGNNMRFFQPGLIRRLTNLTTLYVGGNDFTLLSSDIFSGLTKLRTLAISNNKLTGLPATIFSRRTNLTTLNLSGSNFTSLPDGIFSGLTNLTTLDISDGNFTSLPDGIFSDLTSLTTLDISSNNFKSLPAGIFSGLTSPTRLGVRSQLVGNLSLTVSLEKGANGQFKAVVPAGAPFDIVLPITVTNGSIDGGATSTTIPSGSMESEVFTVTFTPGATADGTVNIGTLPELPSDHSGYRLTKSTGPPSAFTNTLPTGVTPVCDRTSKVRDAIVAAVPGVNDCKDITAAHLAAITSLDLENKSIRFLRTGDFSGLTALEEIELSHNDLTSLPSGIFDNLPNLTSLDLYFNGFTSIPDAVLGLTTLTELNLGYHFISTIPNGTFDKLTQLERLVLDGPANKNTFTTLPDGVFDQLTSLRSLNLSQNDLTSLPNGVFDNLTSLEYLNLNRNYNLTSLRDGVFDNLASLTSLTILGRILTTGDLSELSSLEYLNLNASRLNSLPDGIFSGLSSLERLILSSPASNLSFTVSLKKVADGQFKAVAPIGAPFDIVLPLTVTNGSISNAATSITIPVGSVESSNLTVKRTTGTTAAVTVNIGNLPAVPSNHSGYALVKSTTDLPLTVIPAGTTVIARTNNAPVFTDGTSATRSIAENTASGQNIGSATSATDADNDTLTYTLGGTDASSFSIVSTSGQLQTNAALDYETKTSYSVTVSVSDGNGGSNSITVTINVTDVADTITPPLSDRTPQVRDSIVAAAGVNSAADVTPAHLSAITSLNLSGKSISSLKAGDFNGLTSLRYLYLYNNSISDITALGNLTSLRYLYLGGNSISDIATLENLTSLKWLLLGGNSISDISVLAHLTALTWLDLENNPISNISVLAHLTALRTLNLSENYSISNISVLAHLTALRTLNLERNSISDVSALESLTSLDDLILKNNSISDYGPLRRLKAANPDVNIDIDINNNPPVFSEGTSTTRSIAENTSTWRNIGTPISATDVDNDTLDYFLRGTDAALFHVGLRSGQLQNRAPLDYETKNSYSVTILVKDGNGGGARIDVTINVTDVAERNTVPTFTDGISTTRSIAENTASDQNIGTAIAATDADSGDTLTYTLGGTDAASFSIVGTSGQLQTNAALDYETKNSYAVTVSVSDGNGGSASITVTINITDANENRAPVFTDGISTTRSIAENTASGQNIGTAIAATDADNDTLTYTLGGTDAAVFSIISTTGQLQTNAALDYETKNAYSVAVSVSDGNGGSVSITVTITVTDVNELPASAGVCKVGDVLAPGQSCTYPGTDTEFSVSNNGIGQFLFFTAGTNLNIQNTELNGVSYTLVAKKLASGSWEIEEVANSGAAQTTNTAPVFTDGTSTTRSIAENTAANINIGTAIAATDADNDTLTYTLSGADAASFSIVSTSGQLQTKAPLDYETKSSYTVTITVSDGNGGSDSITVTINVTDRDEIPAAAGICQVGDVLAAGESCTYPGTNTEFSVNNSGIGQFLFFTAGNTLNIKNTKLNGVSYTLVAKKLTSGSWEIEEVGNKRAAQTTNTAPVFTDGASTTRSIAENTAANVNIGTAITATDADNDTLTYTLGGTDAASFSIVSTSGQLQTKAALDYETKAAYSVTITVADGNGGSASITVTINVTDVNEIRANTAPVFTDGTTATRTIAENTAANTNIGTVIAATDADNDTLTYTLSGADASSFSIVSASGQLQTKAALDYETKTSYSVTISVSDGNGGTDSISVTINVTDVDEIPVAAGICQVGDVIAPGGSCTYPGTDTEFSVSNSGIGQFLFFTAGNTLNIKNTKLNGVSYTLVAKKLTSGSWEIEEVADKAADRVTTNTAPVFTDGTSTTRSVAENTAANTNIGTAIVATDADNDTLTYTLSGTDASSFSIVSTTGQLQTKAALDYETKTSYSVTVSAADGNGGNDSITVTINVTNVNEIAANNAPVFTDGTSTTRSVAENTGSGVAISTAVSATDADNDTLTYSLGGTDAASFRIVSTTGQLQTNAALDYETKNTYTVTVSVSDGSLTDIITVTINVTDVDELPTSTGICKVGDVLKPGESCTYPGTDAVFSVLDNGNSKWDVPNFPWFNKVAIGGSMSFTADINNENYHFVAKAVANNSWEIEEIGGDTAQQPETPEQPDDTGGTLTLSASTAAPLTEATLHEGIVTLTLRDGAFENSHFRIRNAVSVSGIAGVTRDSFGGERINNTRATIELEYEGNMTTNGTLTISVGADAIKDYSGPALTAQIPITAVSESIVASTAAPLTEATLDESIVTVTLSGRKFERYNSTIRGAVSVSGITGVTVRSFDIDRQSDTEVTVELTFNGNMNADGTLTFTVGAGGIAGYNGPALTAQVAVAAGTGTPVTPEVPETPAETNTLVEIDYAHIQGPWLWMIAPGGNINTDNLSEASEGVITESRIAQNGVNEGDHFDELQWTSGRLRPTTVCGIILCSSDNVINVVRQIGLTDSHQLDQYSAYALINISSPRAQNDVLMGVGSDDSIKVWLNGSVVYTNNITRRTTGIQDRFNVNLKAGNNLLLIKVCNHSPLILNNDWGMFFKIYLDTADYTVSLPTGNGNSWQPDTPEDTTNTAPVFADGTSTTRSIAENTATGQHIGNAVAATDADKHTLTYTLGGTDAAAFGIDATTGQLKTKAALDYETKRSYSVTVSVSDGNGGTDSIRVTINVTDVNEVQANTAPVFTDGTTTTRSIAENTAARQNIGAAISATDADNDTLTYTLSGTDASAFSIVSTSGQLRTQAALDYETKTAYSVTVSVSDGNGGTDSITVTINVSDVAETPATTPTISVSSNAALTEATLHDGKVFINLSNGTFETAFWDFQKVSVSGITGVTFDDFFDVDRESATQLAITLTYDGNMTANGTLTFTVDADAIQDYGGASLTAQIAVSAVTESLSVSPSTLTEGTLDGAEVSITLSGRKFERSIFDIRDAVSVSGIAGVTMPWHQPRKKSDTEITIELEFNGNMNTDGTLTFTVGVDAIAGYNGPAFAAQVTVTADGENALLVNFPNPFNPETWIPYQLAKPADVRIGIYAIDGKLVRTLDLGLQAAGIYQTRSRAAYWDGKNASGEPVASGVYFYTITAGDFTATRKMLIRK